MNGVDHMRTMACCKPWRNRSLYSAAYGLAREARLHIRGAFPQSILLHTVAHSVPDADLDTSPADEVTSNPH